MDNHLLPLQHALIDGSVPPHWQAQAYPSSHSHDLSAWLADACARLTQLGEWSGAPNEPPRTLWLGGLVHPEAFLTAIRQVHSMH
jgi:Dynein heavy chain C-terminal domain